MSTTSAFVILKVFAYFYRFVNKITAQTDLTALGSHGLDIKLIDFGACKVLHAGQVENFCPKSENLAGTQGNYYLTFNTSSVH
jgi:hypothetical protein